MKGTASRMNGSASRMKGTASRPSRRAIILVAGMCVVLAAAVVTGAASGLGEATVRMLADKGV